MAGIGKTLIGLLYYYFKEVSDMTETSDSKSKRSYLKLLNDYEWNYQHSLFYEDIQDSKALLDDMVRFKQLLRRKCPSQPFLIRIQLHNRKTDFNPDGGVQAFLVILTTINAHAGIAEAADNAMQAPYNVLSKKLTIEKTDKMASTIKSQKPHNLERFFGKFKVNRFSLLNRKKLSGKSPIKTV